MEVITVRTQRKVGMIKALGLSVSIEYYDGCFNVNIGGTLYTCFEMDELVEYIDNKYDELVRYEK